MTGVTTADEAVHVRAIDADPAFCLHPTMRSPVACRRRFHVLVPALLLALAPLPAAASVKVFESADRSLELGLRLQPRSEYTHTDSGGRAEDHRDFYIRRTRLRVTARLDRVSGFLEWRIDGVDQAGVSAAGAVENVWIQFPIGAHAQLRAGQFDQPFSRDRMISYARQMAADRGTVSEAPGTMGLTDKAIGLELMGRLRRGRAEYRVGMFDNRTLPAARQDVPMFVGRLDLNFGETEDVFEDAHFGAGRWYSLAVNGSFQGSIENAAGARDSSNAALGVDGMLDVPCGGARLLVRGELHAIRTRWHAVDRASDVTLRMIGAGLMIRDRVQPFFRFDQVTGDPVLRPQDVALVGATWYQHGQAFKLTADLRLQAGTGAPVDGARLQAQIDF
jgi:hypothetical protein